jgi:hypothetical protein
MKIRKFLMAIAVALVCIPHYAVSGGPPSFNHRQFLTAAASAKGATPTPAFGCPPNPPRTCAARGGSPEVIHVALRF